MAKEIIKIDKAAFLEAANKAGCTNSQMECILNDLKNESTPKRSIALFNTIYSLGALIIFCALLWLLWKGQDLYGDTCLLFISSVYACTFYVIGIYLWKKKNDSFLSKIALFLSLCNIPLVTYAFQSVIGCRPGNPLANYESFYRYIQDSWIFIGLSTIAFTLVTIKKTGFGLLSTILYMVLWYFASDLAPLFVMLFSNDKAHLLKYDTFESVRIGMSILCSLLILATAYRYDRKKMEDFSFWGYIFGVSIFSISIATINYDTEWGYSIYCFLNILLIILSSVLNRKVFAVWGVLGVLYYLAGLFVRYFYISMMFPLILSFAGILVVTLGIIAKRKIMKQKLKQAL